MALLQEIQELMGSLKAQEISKDDFKKLVTILVRIAQKVFKALDAVGISVQAGEDSKGLEEPLPRSMDLPARASQNFLEIQEEEKQVDALGQYGLEEFLEPGEDPNMVEELTDAEDGEEEERQGDASQGQFGLKEFSLRSLDLPAKGTLVSFALKWLQAGRSFHIDGELATAGNINSLMENLRKGEG